MVVRGAKWNSWLRVAPTFMGRGTQDAAGARGAMIHSEVSIEWRGGWWWSCSVTWSCRQQLVTCGVSAESGCQEGGSEQGKEASLTQLALTTGPWSCCPGDRRSPMTLCRANTAGKLAMCARMVLPASSSSTCCSSFQSTVI